MNQTTKIILVILHIICIPSHILTLFLLFLHKQFIILLSKLTHNFVGPVPSGGSLFLADSIWTNPSASIIHVMELNEKVSEADIISKFQKVYDFKQNSGERCYKELGYYPVLFCGYGFWQENPNFEISSRVHILPQSENGEEPISSICERMMREPYLHGEPFWDIYLYYQLDGDTPQTIIITRFHHLIGDGMSFVKLFYAVMGFRSLPPSFTKPSNSMQRWRRLNKSVSAKIFAIISLVTVGFVEYVDQVLVSKDRNVINYGLEGKLNLTGKWICNLGKRLDLAKLKRASKSLKCNINHLLLCGINIGLEKYFLKYHSEKPPPENIHLVFPLPVPGHPDLKLVNHFALARIQSSLNLPLFIEKIEEVKDEIHDAVDNPLPLISAFMFKYVLGLLPVPLIYLLSRVKATSTIVLSNIVGPQLQGQVENAVVTDMYFFMPIVRESLALSAGIISYTGGVRICLTADIGCIPDRSRLDDLGAMIYQELADICKVTKSLDIWKNRGDN